MMMMMMVMMMMMMMMMISAQTGPKHSDNFIETCCLEYLYHIRIGPLLHASNLILICSAFARSLCVLPRGGTQVMLVYASGQ